MSGNTQKLSIRLLREGVEPEGSLREGVDLVDWGKLDGAKIVLETMGGKPPKWARFLELTVDEKNKLHNQSALGLVFLCASERWFAVSFGMGHVKLDPSKFEQDFGLRVVLNAVDPRQLKSADIRTPDENTLSRRSQTSRGSDQTAFSIDVERDIVRGLAGTPKDKAFALRVAGSDSLSLDRKMTVADLSAVCADTYEMYLKTDYQAHFKWIDQIKHVREQDLLARLNADVVTALDATIKGGDAEGLHLAFPVIYDPEKSSLLRYKGFHSNILYHDLDIGGYLDAIQKQGKVAYTLDDFENHAVHEVDDEGKDCGGRWKISDCMVFETNLDGHTYVLSGGRWYQIAADLATEVQAFFKSMPRSILPEAEIDENEEKYNNRLKGNDSSLLCLDRKLIKPTGATTDIEVCDFLGLDGRLIHVKDKTSSSRLSHLFNQGTVSARVLVTDPASRDRIREKIQMVQDETGQTGFENIICSSVDELERDAFTVIFAVIASGKEPKLPFFSLVTLRHAAKDLQSLGFKSAFAWITKPVGVGTKKGKSRPAKEPASTNETMVEVPG
jgi:uncharacterized protein (TIGR04141 family)